MSNILFKGETFQVGEDQAKKIISGWASARFGFNSPPPVQVVNCKADSIAARVANIETLLQSMVDDDEIDCQLILDRLSDITGSQ